MKTISVTDAEFELIRLWVNDLRKVELSALRRNKAYHYRVLRENISLRIEAQVRSGSIAAETTRSDTETKNKRTFRESVKLLHPDLDNRKGERVCEAFIAYVENYKRLPRTTAVAFPGFSVKYKGQWWTCTAARIIWPRIPQANRRRFYPMALSLERGVGSANGSRSSIQITSLDMDDAKVNLGPGLMYRMTPVEPGEKKAAKAKALSLPSKTFALVVPDIAAPVSPAAEPRVCTSP